MKDETPIIQEQIKEKEILSKYLNLLKIASLMICVTIKLVA
jgi:hypothetical protein